MIYKQGDIVLVKFPFTTLTNAKKRPVLVIKDANTQGDFICFQITSKSTQSHLFVLNSSVFSEKSLPLDSYVKYDKCFTLSMDIVDKKLTSIHTPVMKEIKELFCNTI